MPKQVISTQPGIHFDNVTYTDTRDQTWCPLEHTDYEHHCKNQYHNVQLRSDTACPHTAECFALRARLNAEQFWTVN